MILYWIRRSTQFDIWTEGYVGITSNKDKRITAHVYSESHVGNALRKYPDIEIVTVFEGTVNECLAAEILFRPGDAIGWNIVAGGGIPPSFKGIKRPIQFSVMLNGNQRAKGSVRSKDQKIAAAQFMTGRVHNPNGSFKVGNKIGLGNTHAVGNKHSSEFKNRQKIRMKGNKHAFGNTYKLPNGLKWFNNGVIEKRCQIQPFGFDVGRLRNCKINK